VPPVCSHSYLLRNRGPVHVALERTMSHSAFSDISLSFFFLDLYSFAPTALLSRFRSDFDLSRFDSPLFISCSPSAPWNLSPLGGQSCAEPAKTLSTIFYDFSDFCTRPAGQPITRLETLLILRLILTSSLSGSSLQPGIFGQNGQRARVRGDANDGVSPQFFFPPDCLIAGTGDP
jgi:hypothetical protein